MTRRRFLGTTAAVGAGLTIVPRHCLGGFGIQPPSETLVGALIGNGGRGRGAWGAMGVSNPKMLGVCDVDKKRIGGEPDNKTRFLDFRRVMDVKEIDFVCIATPPHWHALICIAAAQAGKHMYCEKPMTKFIAEGRAVANAVKKHRVVFQIGTHGRFGQQKDHKLYGSGLLKDLSGIVYRAGVPMRLGNTALPEKPVPPELDYDLWLGPAPYKPYNPERVHYKNRFYWDYEGGDLANFGAHRVDPFQYKYAKDDTGPVEIEPYGPWPQHPDAVGSWGWVELKYADGLRLILETGKWGKRYDRPSGDQPKLSEEDKKKLDALPDPEPLLRFGDAIKAGKQAGGNAEASHRATTNLHLANIALRVGRKIRWDPEKEEIVGDEEANRFVNIPMRAPWHLPTELL
jgi:hypothetical protein